MRDMEGYSCSKCGGSGIYIEDNLAHKCSCMDEYMRVLRYREAGLPKKLGRFTFEGFDFRYYPRDEYPGDSMDKSYGRIAESTFKAAKKFASSNIKEAHGKGLLFYGNVGSGKTYLSSAIANYLLRKGQRVLFVIIPDLLDKIRASYSGETELSELELLRQAKNIPVLILDDLGVHNYTDWARNKIYTILNSRLIYEKPTVINTNLDLDAMEEHIGERTTSRIVELCDVHRLAVPRDIRHMKNLERRA
ncbi:MAG: ATP-binding protein [Clostridia bacterium]|nr:ATP-binding protein [Clostridia bacterium]